MSVKVRFSLCFASDWGNAGKTIQSGASSSLGLPDYISRKESVPGEFIRTDGYLFFAVSLAETTTIGQVASGDSQGTFGYVQFADNQERYIVDKAMLYNAGNLVYIQCHVSLVVLS